jgi:putative Mg2+ transporter-C (MgtC) family protein
MQDALTLLVRLLLAACCGAAVGWERELHEKRAGLRTHTLICLGACLFSLVALRIQEEFAGTDVMRVVQGLLLGIGFVAGGVIFTHGHSVYGLTTAAGLWVLTGVGLAIGF